MKLSFILIIIFFISQSIKADQKDPVLDELFNQLQSIKNINQHNIIINKIWNIWLQPSNIEIEGDFNKGLELMKNMEYGKSLFFLSRVINDNPDFAEAWNKRATVYFLIGDYEKSIKDINKTLLLEPRHFGAMDGLALIFFNLKKYSETKKIYQEILKILPHSTETKNKIVNLNNMFLNQA